VRYLRSHAPATPEDLSAWSGIRTSDAKRAWRSIEDRLVPLETARGPMWSLRGTRSNAPPGLVRLLPSFDEYLLGWRDRSFAVDTRHLKEINRGGGWISPVILHDGRAAGTWKRADGGTKLMPFSRLPAAARDEARAEAQRIEEFYSR
jgi:winged helix DNA-binding protein